MSSTSKLHFLARGYVLSRHVWMLYWHALSSRLRARTLVKDRSSGTVSCSMMMPAEKVSNRSGAVLRKKMGDSAVAMKGLGARGVVSGATSSSGGAYSGSSIPVVGL
eukprot:CAMPEP_0198211110 /NCGR_PEP_ID=MMETSP1445-20131203/22632_1 /TAXON_ID=36898 /ORGANISM="Pyramimonas sp., Strain CCMP2087" /LENGTH=106 /DNA_ID=CAMNT_0043885311 /DNA_START=674 /DNA_END=994 /DNA_ORIENTATION=-